MEKYAKRLQDIINEQDFCFEPEEIRTVEKALGVLKKYEDADIPAEACVEYRKFEDELIHDGMSLQHVLDLLKAEREGRLKVRPESLGQCCGQCHHFLREPMKASGICEVRKNKHYPRAGTPLYCCQSKKACLDFDERGDRQIRYDEGEQNIPHEEPKGLSYPTPFEEWWTVYPRKIEKGNAYKKYQARRKDGYSDAELMEAAKNYAAQCKKQKTEKQYIKHPKTFLSEPLPFLDFLPKKTDPQEV